MKDIDTIIFDLGGVLINWDPRKVYRTIFKTENEIDWFFENICTSDWNETQDSGYPISKATEERVAQYPEWEKEIRAFYGRWEEMLGGPIQETLDLFKELKQNPSFKFYALTNWSAETFPIALKRFEFLEWFDGILVSGEEKTRKPFSGFYQKLLDKYSIDSFKAIFIDDNLRNVKAGENLGIKGIHFTDPANLKLRLNELKLL